MRVGVGVAILAAGALQVWSESAYFTAKSKRYLQEVATAVVAYKRATGTWPQSLEELAPPKCAGDACILLGIPRNEYGRDYTLFTEEGCLAVRSPSHDAQRSSDGRVVRIPESCQPNKEP